MKKLLIFLMIAIPLVVIFIVNVTVDAVAGIVIIPVDSLSIVCNDSSVEVVYDDDDYSISQVNVNDISKTVKLGSAVFPESATNKEIFWESTDESVAVVDRNGNVTFLGFGSVDIYAISSDGTRRTSCMFVVTDTRVHDISIYADNTILEIGSTTNIWARVVPSSAINQSYSLVSSDENVISVNSAGIATALSTGEATIIATANDGSIGYNCTASLTIKVVKTAQAVKIYPEEEKLTLATDELRLRAIITPTDATNKNVTYTTTDSLIATVSNEGVVKFLKAGEVIITVITEDGNLTDSISLKYTGGYPISLNIDNSRFDVDVSSGPVFKQIGYSFSPENPPIKNISFSSLDESVATVDKNGLVKIFGGGSTTITVKVQTSEGVYFIEDIAINSERKIDSILFSSESITTATSEITLYPLYLPTDATKINSMEFLIISGDCATVSEFGVVTFNSAGEIVVKAYDREQPSVFATITLIYTGGYPADIVVESEETTISTGEFGFLNYTLYPIGASIQQVEFKVMSGESVISIDSNGIIKGLSGGSAIVKISIKISEDDWIHKDCVVNVTQDITGIEIDCIDIEKEIFEDKFISAKNVFNFSTAIFPLDATYLGVEYTLSDSSIAHIVGNNQIHFNRAGVVTLTVSSIKNPNIKSQMTFWYTGGCAVSATIEGIPEEIVNGDFSFNIYLSNIVPANATNKSFKIALSNIQSISGEIFSISYNPTRTNATLTILDSGSATLSILLANADGSNTVFTTKSITILQKVSSIAFPFLSQTISSTQFNLQCEVLPVNATQHEITYSLSSGYESLATINGSILTFNPSANASETVVVIATLIDIDGNEKSATMEITSTFGVISSPEGNQLNLAVGNSVVYDYSTSVTPSTILKVSIISGKNFISFNLFEKDISITALMSGKSNIQIQLLNKTTNEIIEILADLEITITESIENIIFASESFSKVGTKYTTAQNDINLVFDVLPSTSSSDGLIISILNPSIAIYDCDTKTIHFLTSGTTDIIVSSPDGSCSRSFTLQYTNGKSISYSLNIESDSNFYLGQNYLVSLTSFLPTNANLSVINISEIILSGDIPGIETTSTENGILVTFLKSGTIKLKIKLSDDSEKMFSLSVTSALSEILFENETILTALPSITLNPILLPTTATNKTVTYLSSDTSIATVSANGIVTFLKTGSVIITVRSTENENVFNTCTITSTMGDISDFRLNYTSLTLAIGESRNLVTLYQPVNATNTEFTYEIVSFVSNDGSSNPTISLNGNKITGLRGGVATIKVSITNQDGEVLYKLCNITVVKELINFTVAFDRVLDIYQNYFITSINELNLVITLNPADATITSQSISIDNNNIAKIEDGKLKFLTEGIVRIIFNYNNKLVSIMIRYTQSAVSFEIDDPSSTVINGVRNVQINTGETYQVKVKNVIPSDLLEKTINLSLHLNSPNYNSDECTTTNGALITGMHGGAATYKISVAGYTSEEKLKITVIRLASNIVTETNIITPNTEYPLVAYVTPYDTTDKSLTYTINPASAHASVNQFGTVTFTDETTVTIIISNQASGISKTVTITYDMGAKQIIFKESMNYVFIGGTLTFDYEVNPYNLQNEQIEWSVSDPQMATISSNGVLTPKNIEGTVSITAKLKNYPETIATKTIQIYANIYAISLEFKNADDASCGIAETRVFGTHTLNPGMGETFFKIVSNNMLMSLKSVIHNCSRMPALKWISSDESIATIDENGMLTVLKAGKVKITCEPAKQYNPGQPISASYTFTFIDGININDMTSYKAWKGVSSKSSQFGLLNDLDENGNHPGLSQEEIEKLKHSQFLASLPGVLQSNLTFNGTEGNHINKDLYGNGYIMYTQLDKKPSNYSFHINDDVTINNVYFRGYAFESSNELLKLKDVEDLIHVEGKEGVAFKNCIIDGAKSGVKIMYSKVTFSGCIIKNTYEGGIYIYSGDSNKSRSELLVKNSVIENCLLGCITTFANIEATIEPPKITLEGLVYFYNWQTQTAFSKFTFNDEYSSLNSFLQTEIVNMLVKYKSEILKIYNGENYVHLGVTTIAEINVTGFHHEKYEYTLINNTNINYGTGKYYENSFGLGYFKFKNAGLSATSNFILPGQSYTQDSGTYRRIQDLT